MAANEDTRVAYDPVKLAQQRKHLDLLAVFHYVVAGIAALLGLLFLFHIVLGGLMLANPAIFDGAEEPPPAFLGCFFVAIGVALLLGFWAYAAFTAYAGRCLARRRRYMLCLVSAGISCTFSPFGTILGIFTIIVLMQPGVREVLFAQPEPRTEPVPMPLD